MKIGDKVLCIDDRNWRNKTVTLNRPKIGEIYTIRELEPTAILLIEIVNRKYNCRDTITHAPIGLAEPSFFKWRFMPWNPKEEEISIMEERVLVNP